MNEQKIAAFICQIRKAKGMTQKELAERLYVTDKAVSKWERGQSSPNISVLPRLAEVLDVTVDEILRGDFNTDPDVLVADNEEHYPLEAGRDSAIVDHQDMNGGKGKNTAFFQQRYIRVLRFMPVLWTCFFGLSAIAFLIVVYQLDSMRELLVPVLLDMLMGWLVLSSITGFIPLILCFVWYRQKQVVKGNND
ncbi:MAG: helix-turn-helix domain-containing protein [Lachnospiraceae bacterium]|jgi:transcriptional regulator with XRE-family HTH domain|nr:helix-turn-helix domain-containing protein [Lachnospiraceae bacterium]